MALSTTVKVLMGTGAICGLISTSCFLRMIVQLNGALPAEKRISLWKLREDFFEIKRLHEDMFPISRLRTAWFLFMVGLQVLAGTAIVFGVAGK